MKEKIDLKTLRLFPYVIFTMLLILCIIMMVPLFKIFMADDFHDVNMSQMNDSLYMMCYFFLYMAIVGILSCLYHLSLISRKFGISCNLAGAYVIVQAISYIITWIFNLPGFSKAYVLIIFLARLLPNTLLMLMILFVLIGIAEIYKEQEKKKESLRCVKLEVYLIGAFAVQMAMTVYINIVPEDIKISIFFGILALAFYIYNIVVMVILYTRIKKFCYDYYIYSYNSGI